MEVYTSKDVIMALRMWRREKWPDKLDNMLTANIYTVFI